MYGIVLFVIFKDVYNDMVEFVEGLVDNVK